MRRLAVLLIAVVLLSGAFAWWWNQPAKVVARRVAGLIDAANVEADAGNFTRGTRGEAITGYLAPNVTLDGPEGRAEEIGGLQSRDSLASLYNSLAQFCRRISLHPPEIDAIEITGDEASVEARVDAVVELKDGERPADGIQHLAMTWRKSEGKWRLVTARWHETGR